jgi:hypothetical protein
MYIESNDTAENLTQRHPGEEMNVHRRRDQGLPWYRTPNATQWKTLLASNLGWVFDGFEAFALILTVGLAMRQLLSPADLANLPTYAGGIIALTLIGWAIGGMAAGVVADYIGRKRTMILSILTYSIMTGPHGTGPRLPCCASWSGSQSAPNG